MTVSPSPSPARAEAPKAPDPAAVPTAPVLAVQGLRLRWPGAAHDVLDIPALQLQAGERVMLRGESGGGKSTLLSLAAGVLLPTAGQVSLLGQSWQALRPGQRDRRRAQHLGYIFQQFNLLPYLNALDNVLLPCRVSAPRLARAGGQLSAARAQAQALLQALQLHPDAWARPAGQLSVGQQQRVAAARALIGAPALVLADEPTSALDDQRRDAFMDLLLQQCERSGSALLFVSHDSRLARHFSRVVELNQLNRAASANAVDDAQHLEDRQGVQP